MRSPAGVPQDGHGTGAGAEAAPGVQPPQGHWAPTSSPRQGADGCGRGAAFPRGSVPAQDQDPAAAAANRPGAGGGGCGRCAQHPTTSSPAACTRQGTSSPLSASPPGPAWPPMSAFISHSRPDEAIASPARSRAWLSPARATRSSARATRLRPGGCHAVALPVVPDRPGRQLERLVRQAIGQPSQPARADRGTISVPTTLRAAENTSSAPQRPGRRGQRSAPPGSPRPFADTPDPDRAAPGNIGVGRP